MDQCGRCHEEDRHHLLRHLPRQGVAARLRPRRRSATTVTATHDDPAPRRIRTSTSQPGERAVATCGQCHEARTGRFAGYLTHATHHDPEEVPLAVLDVLGHDDAAGRHDVVRPDCTPCSAWRPAVAAGAESQGTASGIEADHRTEARFGRTARQTDRPRTAIYRPPSPAPLEQRTVGMHLRFARLDDAQLLQLLSLADGNGAEVLLYRPGPGGRFQDPRRLRADGRLHPSFRRGRDGRHLRRPPDRSASACASGGSGYGTWREHAVRAEHDAVRRFKRPTPSFIGSR